MRLLRRQRGILFLALVLCLGAVSFPQANPPTDAQKESKGATPASPKPTETSPVSGGTESQPVPAPASPATADKPANRPAPSSSKPPAGRMDPSKSGRSAKPSLPTKVQNGLPSTTKETKPAPPVETVLSDYTGPNPKPQLDWMETFSGELLQVNSGAQRIMIRDVKTRRTKLININRDTVFKKGDEVVRLDSLRLGIHLTAKYNFLDSTARLIMLLDSPSTPSK